MRAHSWMIARSGHCGRPLGAIAGLAGVGLSAVLLAGCARPDSGLPDGSRALPTVQTAAQSSTSSPVPASASASIGLGFCADVVVNQARLVAFPTSQTQAQDVKETWATLAGEAPAEIRPSVAYLSDAVGRLSGGATGQVDAARIGTELQAVADWAVRYCGAG